MATIQALAGRTVHQIQSGQVIVDLCSVAKELVENSLDAGATSVEVRFKNYGLESIEVQDNGTGISKENYETVALKHFTSKLSSYEGLTELKTFGFRGEALSSLCALSHFHIVTAQENEAPKGTRLDFEISGKVKSTSVVASQRGTLVAVEDLFANLPVRRRELEKNIKREYGKVLNIMQAYACINIEAKIVVTNVMAKGKKAVVFATRTNSATRENIANVFGTRALAGLIPMNLEFQLTPTIKLHSASDDTDEKYVSVIGHISRPVYGGGRQAPDRQLFFVNSRPCGLPQVAKVFNEVYKSYNLSQSPFVFANLVLDTNAYDVNVSPDKRTILLHDQEKLLGELRQSVTELFETQEQTVPQSIVPMPTLISMGSSMSSNGTQPSSITAFKSKETADESRSDDVNTQTLLPDFAKPQAVSDPTEESFDDEAGPDFIQSFKARTSQEKTQALSSSTPEEVAELRQTDVSSPGAEAPASRASIPVPEEVEPSAPPSSSIIQTAYDRMRPRRLSPEIATVTIGGKTTTSYLGSASQNSVTSTMSDKPVTRSRKGFLKSDDPLVQKIHSFAANGTPSFDASQRRTRTQGNLNRFLSGNAQESLSIDDQSVGESDQMVDDGVSDGEGNAAPSEAFGSGNCDEDDSEDEVSNQSEEEEDPASTSDPVRLDDSPPSKEQQRRAQMVLQGSMGSDASKELLQRIDISMQQLQKQSQNLRNTISARDQPSNRHAQSIASNISDPTGDPSIPDNKTLTVTKSDFRKMHIAGQFNLGFILTTRDNNDLFIIDQHASDEKINFERLQATTIMQHQRLVQPKRIELTAVDEEIVIEHEDTLVQNGFIVSVDQSGTYPVGQRVSLLSLPMSRETTYTIDDFEELVSLLGEGGTGRRTADHDWTTHLTRPSKTRKVFAMRACRSSIMIGKNMTHAMMQRLVSRMGGIDKPWNCPHGRPTMRHVCNLNGFGGANEYAMADGEKGVINWSTWLTRLEDDDGVVDGTGSEDDERNTDDDNDD